MARKPIGKKAMNRKMTFFIDDDLYEVIAKAKWKLEMDVSEIIRKSILDYLNKNLDSQTKNKFKSVFDK